MLNLLFDALELPSSACMERRVPKALLAEHGASGAGDRKLVEGGIERLSWRASLKPATIGVPTFADETRDYREIPVLTLETRDGANAARLAKIAHAAIPYPLILIAGDGGQATLSLAPKRRHERQADRFVAERLATTAPLAAPLDGIAEAFLASLTVAQLPTANLWSLYEGVIERAEAYSAARITGAFRVPANADAAVSRRYALATYADQVRSLRSIQRQVRAETRLSNRLTLAKRVAILEDLIAQTVAVIQLQ